MPLSIPIRRFASSLRPIFLQQISYFPRRSYATSPLLDLASKEHLPADVETWSKLFKSVVAVNHRVSIRNPKTAAKIADAFVPEGSKDKIVIEAYPGPGQLTRALLNLPKDRIKKLIVLEEWAPYLEWLKPLQETDPRLIVLNQDGFQWSTYSYMEEQGLLDDVSKLKWTDGVHPQLSFISHLPSTIKSEQMVSQVLRSMPEATWLFQYGRVPLNFIISDYISKLKHLAQRLIAAPGDVISRCKLTLVADATAKCTFPLDFEDTQSYKEHFYPVPATRAIAAELKKDSRAVGRPFRVMNIVPIEKSFVPKGQMDAWDFVLRRLYVKKSTELKKAIPTLAPNAQILIKTVTDPSRPKEEQLDVSKKIKDMNARDWQILLQAFDEWPFKPDV
ncbi:hypothetical protein H0H92_014645 [Tricholoma furcatifolium]|nr:hypothetical protein H0H92_014645 [Tricholoma furcatifolium]